MPYQGKAKSDHKVQSGMAATIFVEWGYDEHSINLSPENWASVKAGKELLIEGEGYYYEGDFFHDYWHFAGGLDGRLTVTYNDDPDNIWSLGTGWEANLSDALIEEHP